VRLRSTAVQRVRTPELMDAPGVDREELAHALGFIRWVNRNMGGNGALIRWLKRWTSGELAQHWLKDRSTPITLLDVATGSADVPLAARRWAASQGLDLRITAIDLHPTTLDLAREHIEQAGPELSDGIELVRCDAMELIDRFGVERFDFVHAGLFLHHLSDLNAMTVLRQMDRVSRVGLVWNDLVRTRAGYAAIHAMTVGMPKMVQHDARVSVHAGFSRAEALEIANQVGLHKPRYNWNLLHHRFTITSYKGMVPPVVAR
jgi:SAM-dependent methyltransferase